MADTKTTCGSCREEYWVTTAGIPVTTCPHCGAKV